MIKIVIASSNNGVIGVGNKLPWHIPAEMSHFKKETMGQNVLMGRKTWESLPSPLKGRTNIVLTSDPESVWGCDVVTSIVEALTYYDDLTVIGGAKVCQQFLDQDLVDVIKYSVVDIDVPDSPDNVIGPVVNCDLFTFTGFDQFKGFSVDTYKRKGEE